MRFRSIICAAGLLALAACATSTTPPGSAALDGGAYVSNPAAPVLNSTTVDEQVIRAAYSTLDLADTAIEAIQARGGLVRGSPDALAVAKALRTARDSLRVASGVRLALSDPDPVTALSQAMAAIRDAQAIVARAGK